MREDFKQFMKAAEFEPPQHVNESILQRIRGDLKVNFTWLFAKLLFLHGLVGAATLSVCPQFSIGPVGKGISGTLYALMQIHPWLCAAFCGTVFLGSSALVSVLALKRSELVVVRRKSLWIYSVLAAVSLAFFMVVGSALEGHFNVEFILMWSLAAIASAWAITQLGAYFKMRQWSLASG